MEGFTSVVSASDNFHREEYINHYITGSFDSVEQPKDAISNRTCTFLIPPGNNGFCADLTSLRMGVRYHLSQENRAVDQDTLVAPIDYFPHTSIKSVEVYVNDVEVSNSGPYYTQRAMLDAHYNTSYGDKHSSVQADGLNPDNLGNLDTPANADGFRKRRQYFGSMQDGHFIYNVNPRLFFVYLKTDISNVTKPLIGGLPMRVVVKFHEDPFILWGSGNDLAAKNIKFNITNAELRVTFRQVGRESEAKLLEDLSKAPIKYRFPRIEGKALSIPVGQNSLECSFLTQTATNPDRIILMLQEESRQTPDYLVNPLVWRGRFRAAGEGEERYTYLTHCQLTIDGVPLERSAASDDDDFTRLHYVNMTEVFNSRNHGNGVNIDRFKMQMYIISFDLTKSRKAAASGDVRQPVKEGHLHLSLRFNEPVRDTITVLALMEYHASFSVDKNKSVLYTYID